MKKFVVLVLMLILFINKDYLSFAEGSNYNSFAYININKGKLLRDYTQEEIDLVIKEKVSNRRFCGWRTYILNDNAKVSFITDTLFSVYNDGKTAVDYTVNIAHETTTKTSISSTGTISFSLKGNIKKFKNDLDNTLKIEGSYVQTDLVKEQQNMVLHVDPQTICIVYVQGEGIVTNGVANFYNFWILEQSGGFEYFTITNSYVRIEKLKL